MKSNSFDKIRQANEKKAELARSDKQHQDQLNNSKSLENVLFQSFQSLVSVLQGNSTKAEAISLIVDTLDRLGKQSNSNESELALVKSGLTTLEKQLKEIPSDSLKQIPKFLEQRETIKVTNLSELKTGFDKVEQAIKSMNLSVEAPQVSVKAPKVKVPIPIVNVPEVDLKPLQVTMLDVIKAVKAVKLPKPDKVDLSKLEKEAKSHSKLLRDILNRPSGGGGGGGGSSWSSVDINGIPVPMNLDASGNLKTTATISTGDIEIGAVELKNGSDDTRATVTAANALKVDGSAVTQPVAGDVANAATDSGNPVKIGGRGATALPTAVTDGQRVNALFSKAGKLVSIGALRENLVNQQTTITSSTAETTIVTANATYKLDLYALIITNTSATGSKITIKDSTAGTTRMVIYVPATDTRGFTLPVDSAHIQNAANTAWTATCGTSVASIEITAMCVQNL